MAPFPTLPRAAYLTPLPARAASGVRVEHAISLYCEDCHRPGGHEFFNASEPYCDEEMETVFKEELHALVR